MFDILWPLRHDLALAAFGIASGLYGLRLEWRERKRVAALAREFQQGEGSSHDRH